MQKLTIFLRITLFCFIFLISLELFLNITGFFYLPSGAPKGCKTKTRILVLGESTSSKFPSRHFNTPWPDLLKKNLEKENIQSCLYNIAFPGTDSNNLLQEASKVIPQFRPHYVIAMMGVNDENYYLKSMDKESYTPKLTRLAKMLWQIIAYPENVIETKNFDDKEMFELAKLLRIRPIYELENIIDSQIRPYGRIERAQRLEYLSTQLNQYSKLKYEQDNIIKLLESAYKLEPALDNILGRLIYHTMDDKMCLIFARDYLKSYRILPPGLVRRFAKCYIDSKEIDPFWDHFFKTNNLEIMSKNNTAENFKNIFQLSMTYNFKLVVMQYPLRDVSTLKYFFSDNEKSQILFINNKENFENALKTKKREDIFFDTFGGDFGHTTQFGHILIGDHLSKELLKEINQ